jgi:hypothetical protein
MSAINLWKAKITTHDGESEYTDDIFIRGAKTEEDAIKEARFQARHWYGEAAEPYSDGLREDCWEERGGYRIIELDGVQKINSLKELLQTLYIVDYKEDHK